MKIIAITTPKVDDNDVCIIRALIRKGIDIVHLRKPDSTIQECRELLDKLTQEERGRIVVHDFPQLYEEFSLKGIHINRNITTFPSGYKGLRTRSCHSFEEVRKYKDDYDYLFLSPIFNSISKAGYKSGFSEKELLEASADGTIDEKVIALGGVTFGSIPYLKGLNFGGAAMLGAIYNTDNIEKQDNENYNFQ